MGAVPPAPLVSVIVVGSVDGPVAGPGTGPLGGAGALLVALPARRAFAWAAALWTASGVVYVTIA
eukprot:SAG22_NODE_502_length_9704_cov_23.436439_8_plen_65_part_00